MTQRFALATLPWQPWKNGAGRTREIAVEPPGAGLDDFGWRLSVAEVALDGPFSVYPGVERCITLLRGEGMRLRSVDGSLDHRLDAPLAPYRFDGAMALHATLLGGPCEDFNLMLRRGHWRGDVVRVSVPATLAPADALCVLAAAGRPEIAGKTLSPGEGLLWRDGASSLTIGGHGTVLAVPLHRLR